MVKGITSLDPNDDGSYFLRLTNVNIAKGSNSTMTNVTFTSSSVSFFHMVSINGVPSDGYWFTISSLNLYDLSYAIRRNVIFIDQFANNVNLYIAFTNSRYHGISFETYGMLFYVKQHVTTPVTISNSTFTNLTAALIYIHPEVNEDFTIR